MRIYFNTPVSLGSSMAHGQVNNIQQLDIFLQKLLSWNYVYIPFSHFKLEILAEHIAL